jgi:uncharacterized protein YjbJ (UPF0337 family)
LPRAATDGAASSLFDRAQTLRPFLPKLPADESSARRSLAGRICEENSMGINKDQVKGRVDETKGAIKEAAGKLVGNPSLEVKGAIERNLGKAQAKVGDLREVLKKASK